MMSVLMIVSGYEALLDKPWKTVNRQTVVNSVIKGANS